MASASLASVQEMQEPWAFQEMQEPWAFQEMQEPWAFGSLYKTMVRTYCKVYEELKGNGSLWIWNIHESWVFNKNGSM